MTELKGIKQIKRYGWIPDHPDQRDHPFTAVKPTADLPTEVDLLSILPSVFDQGQLGSCTANAIASLLQTEEKKSKQTDKGFHLSRLELYYYERLMEGTVNEDSGAMIRDGVKVAATHGVAKESLWPYDITKFAEAPPSSLSKSDRYHRAIEYQSVAQDENTIKSCLAGGNPFVYGFSVYSSFESSEVARTGIVPMPANSESLLGGHAVLAFGYHQIDGKTYIKTRNSWAADWGDSGNFHMPLEYLLNNNLSDDFWTVTSIT